MIERITAAYEHALQAVLFDVSNRGIRIDIERIKHGREVVRAEIARNLAIASNQWGCTVFIGAENEPADSDGAANINATQGKFALLKKLKDLGYNVPKIAKKNDEGEYESEYSTGELALQKMLSTNQFNYPGGDPAIKSVLKIRELGKLKSGYLNARLLNRGGEPYYLSIYNAAGTITGRRSSKKHTFGLGGNGQNFPKHTDLAALFAECLIAREGHIFLFVDQIQAEDWPVSALAQNHQALNDLRAGVDRHTKLASMLFGIAIASRTEKQWKDSMERFLGKKVRHANNYDMKAPRMADELAKEGHAIEEPKCAFLLNKMAQIDPNVKGVFHKYVQDVINATRILTTPFGRERQALSIRPGDTNSQKFKELYAFIPQSTVGDNTGFSLLRLESDYPPEERACVQEGHDSITQDVVAVPDTIYKCLCRTATAFKRTIRFHNGIEVEIPIEAELGYNFLTKVKIKDFSLQGVKEALQKLNDLTSKGSSPSATAVASSAV